MKHRVTDATQETLLIKDIIITGPENTRFTTCKYGNKTLVLSVQIGETFCFEISFLSVGLGLVGGGYIYSSA